MEADHEGGYQGSSSSFQVDGSSPPAGTEQGKARRPRSTMACIRCRKKKVKCDFLQPSCSRCAQAGLPCTYSTPPRRVDGHAFDTLGNHVEQLKARMQKMQSDLMAIKNSLHTMSVPSNPALPDPNGLAASSLMLAQGTASDSNAQGVTWKLSLSPSGLRIDTNIASVQDLYKILLQGISQLSIRQENRTGGLLDPDFTVEKSPRRRRDNASQSGWNPPGEDGMGEQRVWEITPEQEQEILREQQRNTAEQELPKEVLDHLVERYLDCFLCFQVVDKKQFLEHYHNQSDNPIDPLLLNSIFAWTAKHLALHHHFDDTRDPNTIGEYYFKQARQLLKKRFDVSNPDTIHALINMFLYQISSSKPAQAYLYIGLAARMAQDLKLHRKETGTAHEPVPRERLKRLWWTAFWLDSHAVLEACRSTMIDDRDCDVDHPTPLGHEDQDTLDKIEFCKLMIKLISVRRDVAKQLLSDQSGQSLLSAISMLENSLTNWFNALPANLQIQAEGPPFVPSGDGRFQDLSTLLLNIAYHGSWIYLHKLFLPKVRETPTPIALLSLNICTKSANQITDLFQTLIERIGWCQVYLVSDSVTLAAKIHQQAIVLRTEPVITFTAKRNLVRLLHMLRNSTLVLLPLYDQLVGGIEAFLEMHQITDNLEELEKERVEESAAEGEERAGLPLLSAGGVEPLPFPAAFQVGSVASASPAPSATPSVSVPQSGDYMANSAIGGLLSMIGFDGQRASPAFSSSPGATSQTFASPVDAAAAAVAAASGTLQGTPVDFSIEPSLPPLNIGLPEEFERAEETAYGMPAPSSMLSEDGALFPGMESIQLQRTPEDIDAFLQSIGDDLMMAPGEDAFGPGGSGPFASNLYGDAFSALSRAAMEPPFQSAASSGGASAPSSMSSISGAPASVPASGNGMPAMGVGMGMDMDMGLGMPMGSLAPTQPNLYSGVTPIPASRDLGSMPAAGFSSFTTPYYSPQQVRGSYFGGGGAPLFSPTAATPPTTPATATTTTSASNATTSSPSATAATAAAAAAAAAATITTATIPTSTTPIIPGPSPAASRASSVPNTIPSTTPTATTATPPSSTAAIPIATSTPAAAAAVYGYARAYSLVRAAV
ncbi:uncharacterized protein VTP21DRAFT_9473 [Calcarisporiella thermophila]|uniref:uncharacterized protein n=1 Tax=Calcarisporiella thermophila TaxID=911321 RepID=UPI003742F8F5